MGRLELAISRYTKFIESYCKVSSGADNPIHEYNIDDSFRIKDVCMRETVGQL